MNYTVANDELKNYYDVAKLDKRNKFCNELTSYLSNLKARTNFISPLKLTYTTKESLKDLIG